ncbi:ribonuclease H-like protein [Acephala macrosclerotiorum]|nr:ribonuclease H-like protein [Acephala macrosclerotiorum]
MAFECPLCSRTFGAEKDLVCHMSAKGDHVPCTHNGCMKTFKSQDLMLSHVKKEHRTSQLAKGTKINWTSGPATMSRSDKAIGVASNTATKSTQSVVRQDQNPKQVNSASMSHPSPVINTCPRDTRWSIIAPPDHHTAIIKLRQRTHSWEVLNLHVQSRSRKENSAEYESAPAASPLHPKRAAVALDCEMVGAHDSEKEHNVLAQLSVVDYLTGDILIDSLVNPDRQVTNWRTKWSGVTRGAMNTAIRSGQALKGYRGAREELWKHIDSSTVIVGQSLNNDFDVLRIAHSLVVDSGIVTAEAAGIPAISLYGLKTACTELLQIKVQQGRGHDSVEDSLAAREIVLVCLNDPERLEQWAKAKREKHAIAEEKRRLEAEKKRAERRAELDKKISWTRDEWPNAPTKEEKLEIRVNIPPLAPAAARNMHPGHEASTILVTATWSMTLSRSREEWIDESRIVRLVLGGSRGLLKEHAGELGQWILGDEGVQPVVIPPTQGLSLSDDDGEDDSELFVGLLAQVPEMILDQPLDESEDSLLTDPLVPSSPTSSL